MSKHEFPKYLMSLGSESKFCTLLEAQNIFKKGGIIGREVLEKDYTVRQTEHDEISSISKE